MNINELKEYIEAHDSSVYEISAGTLLDCMDVLEDITDETPAQEVLDKAYRVKAELGYVVVG